MHQSWYHLCKQTSYGLLYLSSYWRIHLFPLCDHDPTHNSPFKVRASHSMKINKTESISSCIISEVSFTHLLYHSIELLWRFIKLETVESCWAVSHTHIVICKGNSDFPHRLVPAQWPETHTAAVTLYCDGRLAQQKEKPTWHLFKVLLEWNTLL